MKQCRLTLLWLWGQDHQQSELGKLHLESLLKGQAGREIRVCKNCWLASGIFSYISTYRKEHCQLALSKCNGQGQKMTAVLKSREISFPVKNFWIAKIFFSQDGLEPLFAYRCLFVNVLIIICQMRLWTSHFSFNINFLNEKGSLIKGCILSTLYFYFNLNVWTKQNWGIDIASLHSEFSHITYTMFSQVNYLWDNYAQIDQKFFHIF